LELDDGAWTQKPEERVTGSRRSSMISSRLDILSECDEQTSADS